MLPVTGALEGAGPLEVTSRGARRDVLGQGAAERDESLSAAE